MISAKKAFAAIAAAGLSAAVVLPAQALPPLGRPMPVTQALEELKRENWEPVIAVLGPELKVPPADEDTIESTAPKPSRPMLMILSQKDSAQWAVALKMGEQFMVQAQGTDLKLLPLDNGHYKSVSYKMQVQSMPPVVAGKICEPDDEFDKSVLKVFDAVKIMEGVSNSGQKFAFFADPTAGRWIISQGKAPGVSCIENMGQGYALSPTRSEFTPEWRRNQMKP